MVECKGDKMKKFLFNVNFHSSVYISVDANDMAEAEKKLDDMISNIKDKEIKRNLQFMGTDFLGIEEK